MFISDPRLNLFDILCVILALLLGVLMVIQGLLGLIWGSWAHFTLPPILGLVPFFFGWGIVRACWVSLRLNARNKTGNAD
jgi:hypothetical protein